MDAAIAIVVHAIADLGSSGEGVHVVVIAIATGPPTITIGIHLTHACGQLAKTACLHLTAETGFL